MLHIYVNYPNMFPNYSTITEAIAYISQNYILPEATYPAPAEDTEPVTIHIAPGIYRELLVLERPDVTLLGESCENTILIYGNYALANMEDGSKRGTFRTAAFRIHTHDICAVNLTFQNDAGFGHTVGQALAMYADGDRIQFHNCRFLGSQDTLFTAPLPLKEAQPGGFKGPGEHKARTMGRHYYANCFIQGDVDFIFGGAIAYFKQCEIFSKMPEKLPLESIANKKIYGYVTAASTPKGEPFGYVFYKCRLTGDCPKHSVFLGRPWREYAKTVFIKCEMGEHIHPEGWTDWNKPHGHFYYGEYHSYGPGAAADKRISYSHQLSEEEVLKYTISNILQNWKPDIFQN